MAQKTIDMKQVKQVHQLRNDGIAIKEIARRTGISRKTVKKYLARLDVAGGDANSGEVIKVTNKQLAGIAYNNDTAPVSNQRLTVLRKHFDYAKPEISKTGVTMQGLWQEYIQQTPGGYQYSQYCYYFGLYLKNISPAFHWQYEPGDIIEIDFAGKKLSYLDKDTGSVIPCQVFVGILAFSGLIFCVAVRSQKTGDFVTCINEMVKYIGGLTKTILCDNLRTAVKRADLYEPVFTDMCYQLSEHYHTTFSAARPGKPTDKGPVERAVNIVYNHIFAPLRNEAFISLEALNGGIKKHLGVLNHKPYKGSSESRMDIYNAQERHILKPLPTEPYQLKKLKKVKVQRNYAIQVPDNKHYYTVPYRFVGETVTVYFDARTVEAYFDHERIAFHVRSSTEPQFNRMHEHMPPNHQHMVEVQGWTVKELLSRASVIGEYTHQTAYRILHSSFYPEQNFKACNAMILLQSKYSRHRLEAACKRGANVTRPTLKMIRSILETGLDKQPLLFEEEDRRLPAHDNIRGPGHYR
jgi:transposase